MTKGERTVRGPRRQPFLASLPGQASTATFLGELISRSSSSSILRPFLHGFLERKKGKTFRRKPARSFSVNQQPRPSSTAREPVAACQDAGGHGGRPDHRIQGARAQTDLSGRAHRSSSASSGFGRLLFWSTTRDGCERNSDTLSSSLIFVVKKLVYCLILYSATDAAPAARNRCRDGHSPLGVVPCRGRLPWQRALSSCPSVSPTLERYGVGHATLFVT